MPLTNDPDNEPGTVDPHPTTSDSDTPEATAHCSPAPTQLEGLERQATEEDLSLRQYLPRGSSIVTTTIISATYGYNNQVSRTARRTRARK